MGKPQHNASYWKANLWIVCLLLTIWFLVGFVCSIFGIQWLNGYKIGNVGVGFWMAQQGSIFVFVVLVAVTRFGWIGWTVNTRETTIEIVS